jgi:predicted Ser/Thr protein kinase
MGAPSDVPDETVEASGAQKRARELAPGMTLGKYRLDRVLGSGGMGIVWAAHDPDLERAVALKVLRYENAAPELRSRLLREARAMARLKHPNVLTVYEVDSEGDRDFIAMELVDGASLDAWLATRPSREQVWQAILAAGHGLAAAHRAGLVHRDFKPHNVLRSRSGRIVVTDFGLAREAQVDRPANRESARSLPARATFPDSTPSSLTGITATGSLLGTPAYMAPEQWGGGAVTPATDQFAFCVALWEALAGERPYRGPTLDELRAQAALGPVALDASKIPRRLRAILRRGLDPEPAQRWPNMDALLLRIVRAERRPGIVLAIGVGGLVAAVVLVVAMRAGDKLATRRCDPPALDPVQVWSPKAHAAAGKQTVAAALLDQEIAAWSATRVAACKVEPAVRAPRLWCLDGVLARIDAVAQAARANRDAAQIDAGALLIDPKVCELPRAPRLMTSISPEFRDVVTAWLSRTATAVPLPAAAANALVARAAADPCASSLAHLLAAEIQKSTAERGHHLDEAQQDAERCGDDRVLAETALATAQHMMANEWLGATVTAKLRLADAAAHRVTQRDLTAQIDLMRLEAATRAENLDEAIARGSSAMEGFAARGRLRAQIDAGLTVLALRQIRATDADLAAVPDLLATWRARAVAELGESDEIVRSLDTRAAEWAFAHGDVAGAHAALDRLRRPLPNDKPRRVAGKVVDLRGKPVAGATVTAGWELRGDSVGAAVGLVERDSMRSTKTGPDGRFEIPDTVEDAVVIAELGDRRSTPEAIGEGRAWEVGTPTAPPVGRGSSPVGSTAEDVTLQLAPTSRLEGHVDLANETPAKARIVVRDLTRPSIRYEIYAPVAPDGSFAIDGVPRHEVRVFAELEGLHPQLMNGTNITVHDPVVRGIALSLAKSRRVVHVIVRNTVNTKLANAEVVVLSGKVPSMSFLAMKRQYRGGSIRLARQLEGEHAPRAVVAAARPGDLFATMTEVPDGIASACAFGLFDLSDEELTRKLYTHLDKLQVICTEIPEDAELVMIEVPPFPRLD